ncbi:MAG: T9SS type A sorting domain-containing protein [bacterium]
MTRPLCSVGVALALAGGLASSAPAATIRVPQDQPTIAAGLEAAAAGDSVVIACGTYHERDLALRNGVTVRSESGDPSCVTIDAVMTGTIFLAENVVTPAVIEGVTITQGIGSDGGGMRLVTSNVVLRRCVVLGNVASQRGGGIFVAGGTLRCEDCVVVHNAQTPPRGGGAGIFVWYGAQVELLHCTVAHNDGTGVQPAGASVDASWCILAASSVATATCCWTADPLFCDAAANDFRLSSSSPCLPGVTCLALIGALGWGCGAAPEARSYVVTTDPPGFPIRVDGTTYKSPWTFTWLQYSPHSIAVESTGEAHGVRYTFAEWNDGGEMSHVAYAPRDAATFSATYSGEAIPGYEFSISASATDPHVNTGPPAQGVRELHLWVTCARRGLAALEADVSSGLPVLGFAPSTDVFNVGTPTHLLLAVGGCPRGEGIAVRLGAWSVLDQGAGGRFCLGPAPSNGGPRRFTAVDCGVPVPLATSSPGVIGFASDGRAPCDLGAHRCGGSAAHLAARGLPGDGPSSVSLATAPNPFRMTTSVQVTVSPPSRLSLRVYDVGGRLIRSLADRMAFAGRDEILWDGRDGEGRLTPAGIYFVRLDTAAQVITRKVVRLER